MTTNLSGSNDAKAELDQLWAQWVADGAQRDREREKSVTQLAIVIAIALAIWLTKVLVLG
jgi:hypothetical protein